MKILSSIMALIVLFLSSERALAMLEQKETLECCSSCHEEENAPYEETPDKNPCNDKCNPFQPCGSCTGYTLDIRTFGIVNPMTLEAKGFLFVQQSYFHFFPDFWQPPKIA